MTPHSSSGPEQEPSAPENLPTVDDDLIAYLDGELDGPEAARIAEKIANDPDYRARSEAYRKTYNLLDSLPLPEPKADFTARTLTRLHHPESGSKQVISQRDDLQYVSQESVTSSPNPALQDHGESTIWQKSLLLIMLLCIGFGSALAHRYYILLSHPEISQTDFVPIDRLQVIERLPLYMGVDSLEFVRQLDDPELFLPLRIDVTVNDSLSTEHILPTREQLIQLYKSYPKERQNQLQELDRAFSELPDKEHRRLGRVLERYAIWLDRLPDNERSQILSASSGDARIELIRQTSIKHWREGLPRTVHERLKRATEEERLNLVAQWMALEISRSEEWELAQRQWERLVSSTRRVWPFDDPDLSTQVDQYVKSVLKADLNGKLDFSSGCRLSREEFLDLKLKHDQAIKGGNWFLYGLQVYRLSERYPSLPEYGSRPTITELSQIRELRPRPVGSAFALIDRKATRGKWPEFALEVADAYRKASMAVPDGLGPCRPGEFREAINHFLQATLEPKLTKPEQLKLQQLEGKWPDYPRMMIRLATAHDLPVPGVTLPGSPSLWLKYYAINQKPKSNSSLHDVR